MPKGGGSIAPTILACMQRGGGQCGALLTADITAPLRMASIWAGVVLLTASDCRAQQRASAVRTRHVHRSCALQSIHAYWRGSMPRSLTTMASFALHSFQYALEVYKIRNPTAARRAMRYIAPRKSTVQTLCCYGNTLNCLIPPNESLDMKRTTAELTSSSAVPLKLGLARVQD